MARITDLDTAHSLLVTLSEEGYTSAVLRTMASVIGKCTVLETACKDPTFCATVVRSLNEMADELEVTELRADQEDLLSDLDDAVFDAEYGDGDDF